MPTFFKSESGRREIFALYDKKLAELNIDYQTQDLLTSFGKSRIITTGKPGHPPLILIHGSNGCAPIALETYPNLAREYRVFAVDVLAQPNKSEGERLSMKDDSYGKWMNEIITTLDLDQVTMAGFSLGGLVILKTLIHDESRIREVFLASPAYIVNANPLKTLFRIFIPMRRFMKTKDRKYIEQFLGLLFSDRDEFAVAYLSLVFQHFEMDFTPVPVISKAEAAAIRTPITLFAAGDDRIFPGPRMIRRARKLFPSLKSATLLTSSKHVQSRRDNERIEGVIMDGVN